MGNLEKTGMDIVDLFHGKGGAIDLGKPFERDIFLFDTYVAGTSYIEDIMTWEPQLVKGTKLHCYREPENPFDGQAIVITTIEGKKIGYVPKADNVVFARLMDAGKLIFGRVESKEIIDKCLHIGIKVFLHE